MMLLKAMIGNIAWCRYIGLSLSDASRHSALSQSCMRRHSDVSMYEQPISNPRVDPLNSDLNRSHSPMIMQELNAAFAANPQGFKFALYLKHYVF